MLDADRGQPAVQPAGHSVRWIGGGLVDDRAVTEPSATIAGRMALGSVVWLRRRGELLAHLVSLPVAAWTVAYVALSFALTPFGTDLRLYYASARVAQKFGWSHIYDFRLQESAVTALGPGAAWSPYLNPPTMTALALPFAQLPFGIARLLWSACLVAAIGLGWWLSGVGRDRFGRTLLFAAVAWLPCFFALLIGQPALLVGAALVGAVWLDHRGRPVAAGVALALAISLKPQLGLMVPLALLAARRTPLLAGFAAAGLPLALAVMLLLGPEGLRQWLEALRVASGWSIGKTYSLPGSLGGGWLGGAAQVAVALAVVTAAWRRRDRLGEVVTAGVLGSLMSTPYVSMQDFAILAFPAWLAIAANRSWPVLAGAAMLWLAGAYSITLGAWPLIACVLGWLAWLTAAPLVRRFPATARSEAAPAC